MIRGALVAVLMWLNLVLWGTLVILGGIVKFAVQITAPRSRFRSMVIRATTALGARWVAWNSWIFDTFLPTQWDVTGIPADLDPEGHYLLLSNHQSWTDIFVLQRIFHRRAAFIRFFLKQELIWFPILGQACWALEFPFMKRYTQEYVAQHPEKRGKDLETTRRACQRYKHLPVTIANFLEGTRFTEAKRDAQNSPYRNLLIPRSGGISYVLASLGDQLDAVFDVTIGYPGEISVWRFATGQISVVHVRVRRLEVPPEFLAPEVTERGPVRDRFKAWLASVWSEKDQILEALKPTTSA